MDDLLPYYERELGLFRRHARDFAKKYPKVASRLLIAGESVEDPHIERLIQSFSLIAARINKKLNDSYADFTASLFEVLFPDYLKPFPACSIAQLDLGASVLQIHEPSLSAKNTVLNTRGVKGVVCGFKTTQDVALMPIKISQIGFFPTLSYNQYVSSDLNGFLKIKIDLLNLAFNYAYFKQQPLRLFIDSDSNTTNLIRQVLLQRVRAYRIRCAGQDEYFRGTPFSSVGFSVDEALLPIHARMNPASRLLLEYFAFPEKFDFLDLSFKDLDPLLNRGGTQIELDFYFKYDAANGALLKTLEQLDQECLKAFCTPVINLVDLPAHPIRLTHQEVDYELVPDVRMVSAYEIHSVDRVFQVVETSESSEIREFYPFYALNHAQKSARDRYYHVRRDQTMAGYQSGYEYQIMVSDRQFNPALAQTETLSVQLTCTNRDLPAQLPYGQSQGDLFAVKTAEFRFGRFLRRPTESHRFEQSGDQAWRLISRLSLNVLSLAQHDAALLKELLTLHDIVQTPETQKKIEGIVWVRVSPTTLRIDAKPYPSFVRGTQIEIGLIPDNFVGSSIELFAELLSHVLGLHASLNSFVQVILCDSLEERELVRCAPRSGQCALV